VKFHQYFFSLLLTLSFGTLHPAAAKLMPAAPAQQDLYAGLSKEEVEFLHKNKVSGDLEKELGAVFTQPEVKLAFLQHARTDWKKVLDVLKKHNFVMAHDPNEDFNKILENKMPALANDFYKFGVTDQENKGKKPFDKFALLNFGRIRYKQYLHYRWREAQMPIPLIIPDKKFYCIPGVPFRNGGVIVVAKKVDKSRAQKLDVGQRLAISDVLGFQDAHDRNILLIDNAIVILDSEPHEVDVTYDEDDFPQIESLKI
jgi:hypothetical protein